MSKKLIINKHQQLIDLNKDITIFDITVDVKCKNPDDEFQGCIISQKELDLGNSPEFRNFKGKMKVRIANKKDNYQNHYLCLKRDGEPCEVEYNIVFNEVTPELPNEDENIPIDDPSISRNKMEHIIKNKMGGTPYSPVVKKTLFTGKNIILFIILILIVYLFYVLWFRKSKGNLECLDISKMGDIKIDPIVSGKNIDAKIDIPDLPELPELPELPKSNSTEILSKLKEIASN